MRDQVRGSGKDVAGRAVVAFEADDLCTGKVVIEAQDVVDLRAAPAIDRLVVVADAADVLGGRDRGWRRGDISVVIPGRTGRCALLPLPALRGESVGVRGSLRELSRWR